MYIYTPFESLLESSIWVFCSFHTVLEKKLKLKRMFGRGGKKKSDNTKFYEILGVSKNASEDEIKKAYRKASMKNHTDKGGDPEKVIFLFIFEER